MKYLSYIVSFVVLVLAGASALAQSVDRESASVRISGWDAPGLKVVACFPADESMGSYASMDTAYDRGAGNYTWDDLEPGWYDIYIAGRLDSAWANKWMPASYAYSATYADTALWVAAGVVDSTMVDEAGLSYDNLNLDGRLVSADIADGTIGTFDLAADAVDSTVTQNAGLSYDDLNLDGRVVTTDLASAAVDSTVTEDAGLSYDNLNLDGRVEVSDLGIWDDQVVWILATDETVMVVGTLTNWSGKRDGQDVGNSNLDVRFVHDSDPGAGRAVNIVGYWEADGYPALGAGGWLMKIHNAMRGETLNPGFVADCDSSYKFAAKFKKGHVQIGQSNAETLWVESRTWWGPNTDRGQATIPATNDSIFVAFPGMGSLYLIHLTPLGCPACGWYAQKIIPDGFAIRTTCCTPWDLPFSWTVERVGTKN